MHYLLQSLLPQHMLSTFAGVMANSEIRFLKNYLIKYFINNYQVNMDEAINSDPYSYNSFNAFFTRKLKSGVRSIPKDENTLICPVDGSVSQFGKIKHNSLLQAKGHTYNLKELCGNLEQHKAFMNGNFVTLYLAPHDYHRVHMCCAGDLQAMSYIPGKLFSVNKHTTENVSQLFTKNERLVMFFNSRHGKLAVIMVGAMVVGNMVTSWHGRVNPGKQITTWDYTSKPIHIDAGKELGWFNLGSTVILLFSKEMTEFTAELAAGQQVKLGTILGHLISNRDSQN